MHAILWLEAQQHCLLAEENHRKLRIRIFQCEVDVSRWRWAQIGDFPFHPYIRERSFYQFAGVFHQFMNRPDAAQQLGRRLLCLEEQVKLSRIPGVILVATSHLLSVIAG
jgi:hypothetical protein